MCREAHAMTIRLHKSRFWTVLILCLGGTISLGVDITYSKSSRCPRSSLLVTFSTGVVKSVDGYEFVNGYGDMFIDFWSGRVQARTLPILPFASLRYDIRSLELSRSLVFTGIESTPDYWRERVSRRMQLLGYSQDDVKSVLSTDQCQRSVVWYKSFTNGVSLAIAVYVIILATSRITRRITRHPSWRCRQCGYPIHSIDSFRCPECGQIFGRPSGDQD